jgi:hypothetical protein
LSGGALDASVTLDEVLTVLAARRVPLAPELAGYLVLEIAEHADPSGGDVDPRSVFVGEEGTVALVKPRRESAIGDAEASVRAMLGRLLDASGSQTPALAAASKRPSGAGLPALSDELETALIPVNRAAGRRALARLAREVRRVRLGVGRNALPSASDLGPSRRPLSSSYPLPGLEPPRAASPSFSREEDPTTTRRPLPNEVLAKASPTDWTELPTTQFEPAGRGPSPSQADVDDLIERFAVSPSGDQQHARALKAMAGLDPTPPPPGSGSPIAHAGDAEIESLLDAVQETPVPPPPRRRGPAAARDPQLFDSSERQLPTQPSQLRRMRTSMASAPRIEGRRGSRLVPVLAFVAIGAGGYAVWTLRPGALARGGAEPAAIASAPALVRTVPTCRGTLVVSNAPPHSEVLIREGQAPVDVEKMPVGARLEFVATAEGYAPKRVVVPAGAGWDRGADGKPRYEAAVQLDHSKAPVDPWPAGEPGSEVGGQGPPGTVHVVATPRGAEIWLLAGIGPDARIEQIQCDRDWDVLIAGPTMFRKRLHVASDDFRAEDSTDLSGSHESRVAHVVAR